LARYVHYHGWHRPLGLLLLDSGSELSSSKSGRE
jgi:hypothetical protein